MGGDRGVTPAVAERVIRHCLRRAPLQFLTEEVYDVALRAALDSSISTGGGGGVPLGTGADDFARELTLSSVPCRFAPVGRCRLTLSNTR
jgi:hypothetical protein